jgi:hypothetical protein
MTDQMPVLSVNSNNHVPSSIIFNNSLSNLKKNNNKNKGTSSFLWSKILKI